MSSAGCATTCSAAWAVARATVIVGGLLLVGLVLVADWVLFEARWGVITSNMRLFLVGLYPPSEIWRVWALLLVLSLVMGASAGSWRSGAVRMLAIMLAAGQVAIAALAVASEMGVLGPVALVANATLLHRGHGAGAATPARGSPAPSGLAPRGAVDGPATGWPWRGGRCCRA